MLLSTRHTFSSPSSPRLHVDCVTQLADTHNVICMTPSLAHCSREAPSSALPSWSSSYACCFAPICPEGDPSYGFLLGIPAVTGATEQNLAEVTIRNSRCLANVARSVLHITVADKACPSGACTTQCSTNRLDHNADDAATKQRFVPNCSRLAL
jgi:hypothetical protein